jgi:hypothetical protein
MNLDEAPVGAERPGVPRLLAPVIDEIESDQIHLSRLGLAKEQIRG